MFEIAIFRGITDYEELSRELVLWHQEPPGASLPETDVVALQATLQRAPSSEQSGSAGVVAVSVDGGQVLLVLEVVHVVVVPLHPASRCL